MNAFESLGLPVALVVSADEIRGAFRERASDLHPDAGGNEKDFSELQMAQEILLSPAKRLKEWISVKDLNTDTRGQIGGDLMELFEKVSATGSESETIIKQNAQAQSALVKAVTEVKLISQREKVKDLLSEIEQGIQGREDDFSKIQEGEQDAGKAMRDLIFLEKWRGTLKGLYARLI